MNGILYFLRVFLNLSLVFALTFGSSVRAERPVDESATGSLQVTDRSDASSLNVRFEVREIDADSVSTELSEALRNGEFAGTPEGDSSETIVSTDQDAVLLQAAKSKTTLIPFGRAIRRTADLAGGINSLLRSSGLYLVNAFKKDKIGFGIATFTLGNEIVRWIHVTSASDFVITSNIVYSILWSAIFVDKDTWSKTTKPIQQTLRKVFGLSQVIPDSPTASDMAMKFLSGLSLSMILNSGRAVLVGIDQLAHRVFDPLTLSMPFIMGAVMTAVGFSWSELIGSIDEARFPRAKKIMRLVMNSRSCIISYFAASAMLMNPEHYGLMPWIAVTLSGVTGLALYANAKRVLPVLEGLWKRRPALTCEALFAGASI
jgi:hypothetical protein